MVNRYRFKDKPADSEGLVLANCPLQWNRIRSEHSPRLFGRIHRAMRAAAQACRVIRMSVRQHDCIRSNRPPGVNPIRAAIDHQARAALGDE
jgi:hypothetical protein